MLAIEKLKQETDLSKVPKHIGIIMDGNRRWAVKNGLKTFYGHKKGYERLRELVDVCEEFGVKYLTVYAFSSENLVKRDELEKKYLFELLKESIRDIINDEELMKKEPKITFLGRWYLLSEELQKEIKSLMERTKDNSKFFLNVCFVYDGQEEIVDAVKQIVSDALSGKIKSEQIDKEVIKSNLYTKSFPASDLIIRTGMDREKRLSGFLLWDSSYSEFMFKSTLWPDYSTENLAEDIKEFSQRTRRFGK